MLVVLLLSCLPLSGAMQSGIFGGKEAKPHSRPYMASLQISRVHSRPYMASLQISRVHSRPYMASLQVRKYHVWGGVLIRKDYVLTAAHCLMYKPDAVLLGAHNTSKEEKSQQRVGVSEFIPHPKYPTKPVPADDPRGRKHDIMLLKLDPPVKLTKFVSVLELPKKFGRLKAGTRCEVAGWGKRVLGRGTESVLYETTVILGENSTCKASWQNYYNQDQMTCSISDGKDGVCQGDSGGPLLCLEGESRVLYGITAYTGVPCDNVKFPEVYMRVPFFLPWIRSVMGDN